MGVDRRRSTNGTRAARSSPPTAPRRPATATRPSRAPTARPARRPRRPTSTGPGTGRRSSKNRKGGTSPSPTPSPVAAGWQPRDRRPGAGQGRHGVQHQRGLQRPERGRRQPVDLLGERGNFRDPAGRPVRGDPGVQRDAEAPARDGLVHPTQTLAVEGSADGATWTTLSASAGRVFDPATRQHGLHQRDPAGRPLRPRAGDREHRLAGRADRFSLEVYGSPSASPCPRPPRRPRPRATWRSTAR